MRLNSETRVLVLGCGGMLGEAVYRRFQPECEVLATDIDVNEPWLSHLDVRDWDRLWEVGSAFKPDLVINLAALTDLEHCERNPEEAFLTNSLGQENACLLAARLDIPVVYVSTAGIFSGEKESYHDFDAADPVNVYGRTKLQGELVTRMMCEKFYILRAGWMMGGGPGKDKKFVGKIYRQIASGSRRLFVVDDKLGNPTYTVDFADSLFTVAGSELYGHYNMACSGSASRHEVAVEFVRNLGLAGEVAIEVVDSAYFADEYFAPRPRSERLVNLKLAARGMMRMRDWRACLAEYAEAFRRQP